MNDVITQQLPVTQNLDHYMTAGDLTKQALLIQEILEKVMVGPTPDNPQGVHYGIVPGTKKPTLLQPGAEKICATFHLAPKYQVEDLSEPHNNFYRYRVACSLHTIRDGLFVGSACGESSSAEEKYQWEKAVCQEEYDQTDPTRRRIKFKKKYQSEEIEQIQQVQRNAADLSNTVLKIACKRAYVSATRSATAASDLLEVDLEEPAVADLVRQEQGEQATPTAKPKAKAKPAPSFHYGKFKDRAITDEIIPLDYLEYMSNQIAATIQEINADPKHKRAKFKAQDTLFLAALDAEIAHRKAMQAESDTKAPQNASQMPSQAAEVSPGEAQASKPIDSTRKPFSDSSWADFIIYCEEEAAAHYVAVKVQYKVASGHEVTGEKRFGFYDAVMALAHPRK